MSEAFDSLQQPDGLSSVTLSRRSLLRMFSGIAVGAVVDGVGMYAIGPVIRDSFEEITGVESGNAAAANSINECVTAYDGSYEEGMKALDCIEDTVEGTRLEATVIAPLLEELAFRGYPSYLLEVRDGKSKHTALSTVVVGTGNLPKTRREALMGLKSSIAFAAIHNFTSKGFEFDRFHVSAATGGFVSWFLGRKFGLPSAVAGHSFSNYRVVRDTLKAINKERDKIQLRPLSR